MIYGFIRLGLVPVSFIGWIAYQFFSKKKSWRELQPDIMMSLIFIGVWLFIFFQFMS